MPFTPVETSGNWASMRDLADEKEVVRVKKGFLVSDDTNVYKGTPSPRFIVRGILASTGEEVQTGVAKGYSRDINLVGSAEYLDAAPEGTFLDLQYAPTEGSAYIDVSFVGEGLEGE